MYRAFTHMPCEDIPLVEYMYLMIHLLTCQVELPLAIQISVIMSIAVG